MRRKIKLYSSEASALIPYAYYAVLRPILIGVTIVALLKSISLSASAFVGMISSSLNPEVSITCEEDIAYGIQLSKDIRELRMTDALLIEFTEETNLDRIMSQEEWQALQFDVDSRLEALRQKCE